MQNKKGRTITFRVDDEVAELAEHQTLAQSATAMLPQASAISQNILLLFKLTYQYGRSCPQSPIIKKDPQLNESDKKNIFLSLKIHLLILLLTCVFSIGQDNQPHQIKWFATEIDADPANVEFPAPEFTVDFSSDSIIVNSNGIPSFEFIAKTPNGLKVQAHN